MPGSSFGSAFRVTTFGESHGPALGCVVDGCPPGLPLTEADLQIDLDRRRPGQSQYTTQRKEADTVRILSGVFEGCTTGTAIGLLIENEDHKSKDYSDIKDVFRPAHADLTYWLKHGVRDHRGGGRASARETAMRVAAGGIAKKYLRGEGIIVRGCLTQIGHIRCQALDWDEVENNPFFAPDVSRVQEMETLITSLRRDGDSIGARVMVSASGVPPGLGEPVFDKLDAEIAAALMSINAVKGVEIGSGFASVEQRGSEHRDELTVAGFQSNNAGGVLGGISSGQEIIAQMALKPTSSITLPARSLNKRGEPAEVVTKGRHDPCVGIRAVPIAEAMLALVLMDHLLRHRGQNQGVDVTIPGLKLPA